MGSVVTTAVQTFGRYELLAYVGSGAMSDVFAAMHVGLRKRVALKILRPSLRQDPVAVERFQREGECAARVNHPNVVNVTDVGLHQGVPYLVMELLEGEPLDQTLRRGGPLPLASAIDMILPILEGVAATHAAGVLHRDIKPANILLSRMPDGSVVPKLVDFGIATVEERRGITGGFGPIGTPHYMSPEQARGARDLNEKSDQYSIASVLFECLTGREPFPGSSVDAVLASVARGRFPRVRDLEPGIPAAFDEVLSRATELEPSRRFASVIDFAHALSPFASPRTRGLWLSRDARPGAYYGRLFLGVWRSEDAARDGDPASQATFVPRIGGAKLRMALAAVAGAALGAGVSVGAVHGGRLFAAPRVGAAEARALRGAAVERGAQPARAPRPVPMVAVQPGHADIYLDGVHVGRGVVPLPTFRDGKVHELRVSAPGYITHIDLVRGVPVPGSIWLDPERH